jgi:hypothetical protein
MFIHILRVLNLKSTTSYYLNLDLNVMDEFEDLLVPNSIFNMVLTLEYEYFIETKDHP